METGSKVPTLRLENLGQYLDDRLEHEAQVLDLLVVAQARGQANTELWDKLHSAALRDDRLTELAFAYEKLGQDRRVRIMPPPHQAQVFLHAARFFTRALGDLDGAQAALERVLSLVPTHTEAFDQLKHILEDKNDQEKLVALHLSVVGPKTDKETALLHLRAALELVQLTDAAKAGKIAQQIIKLDPTDTDALYAICASLEEAGKYPELARTLEQAVSIDPPLPDDRRLEIRAKLLELYDDRIPEIERAVPHIEDVLAHDPENALARRVAARLLTNKAVGARVAFALEKVYAGEADSGGVAQMLAVQIEQLRGPKKAEAQKRLGNILYDLGDDAPALANFEAVMAIDPADDDVRIRYVELARKLGKQADASKLLGRAAAAVKEPLARARINLESGRFLAELGDPKRARVVLQGVLDQADGELALEAARSLRALVEEPKLLAPILESIAKTSLDPDERLEVLRALSALYENDLKDLPSAIQARKRVLELDPDAEPEELERLLEARGDFATLAEVLEIRAGALEIGDDRRGLLLRAAELRADRANDPEGAATVLLRIRAEHGAARDVHALLLPLLEAAGAHEQLCDVLASELELADETERPALLSWLADCFLATDRAADALEAFAEVLAVEPSEPRARARVAELLESGETETRLRAAAILVPVFRAEDDVQTLVPALEVMADLDSEPSRRIEALAEAHDRVEGVGKDKIRTLFLAGRGLREAVQHDVEQVPVWLERISRSEKGPSKAAVAETLGGALRDRAVDHPAIARLAERTGEAYANAGDLQRAIEAFRRVLELEPDNETAIERIDHLLAEKGSPDERISLYRASLARPGSVDKKRSLYLAIGGVQQEHLNDVVSAIGTYREALEAIPGDRAIREALLDGLATAGDYTALYLELVDDRTRLSASETSKKAAPETSKKAASSEIAALDLRLAEAATSAGDLANAAAHYRDALSAPELEIESDGLDPIEDLAKGQVDVPLLVLVAERRAASAREGIERARALEHLGGLVGDRGGDPARAAQCFLEAAEAALEGGDRARAVADYERVLAYQPETRAALERLIAIHSPQNEETGDVDALVEATRRLVALKSDQADALALVASAISAAQGSHASELLLLIAAIEQRLGVTIASVSARASLLAGAHRVVEAGESLRGFLTDETAGEEAATLLERLLEAHPDEEALIPLRRALFEHRTHTQEPNALRVALLSLFRFELDVARDQARAGLVLDRVLEGDPDDDEALGERVRLALAAGDLERAEACLDRRLSVAADDDARVSRASELAMLRLDKLGNVPGALDAIEAFVERFPKEPALRKVALAALSDPMHAGRAVRVLERVAEATDDKESRAQVYEALFDRVGSEAGRAALGDSEEALYQAWLACIDDDKRALEIAARAAERVPQSEPFWDRAEELARAVKRPEPVAAAYRAVLARTEPPLDEETALRVGERGVAFHEEWFDDQEQVAALLRRVIEVAPAAHWAFERLKLVYNAAERWQELFELFDRAIVAQEDDDTRSMIIEDAVETARDLAGDSERAIGYLEQLRAIRKDDGKIESQLERLYERHNHHASLITLLMSRLERQSDEDARRTRLRVASLWETGPADLAQALEALRPLIETADEESIEIALGWLAKTAPARAATSPGAAYRRLSQPTPGDAVRAPAARLLEPVFALQGEDQRATEMVEITLESELLPDERIKLLRQLTERRSRLGDAAGALAGALAELALADSEADEKGALDAALLTAGDSKENLGRVVDALREIGEEEEDRTRSLRLLRRASAIARAELADDTRAITVDLAILSRSDEDPRAAREAAKKLDRDLRAAKREAERCAVLEQLANLEEAPAGKRNALVEAARIADKVIGDRARAAKALRRWLADVPADVEVLSLLIENLRFLADSKALVDALAARAEATSNDEEAESDRVEIARLYARILNDRPRAIDAYRTAIEKHGSSEELVDELCEMLADEGRDAELSDLLSSEAVRVADKARRSELYARLGDLERRRGSVRAALDAFAASLQTVPGSAKGQAGLETLIGSLSPDDPEKSPLFAAGVATLAQSFEQAGQTDRWLALVPAYLLATKNDLEKCDLLLRAAKLEEEVTNDSLRALERTIQAFALRPEFPNAARQLLERAQRTGRWDLIAPHLLPALVARDDIEATVARNLLVSAADWASGSLNAPTAVPSESRGLAEGFLAAAHHKSPRDEEVLEKLVLHRRAALEAGAAGPLVAALLSLSALRGGDLALLREAATVALRDLGDQAAALSIAEELRVTAGALLGTGPDEESERALLWAIDVMEPVLRAAGEATRLREALLGAASLPIDQGRARSLFVEAAKLSDAGEAAAIYERLYAQDPTDFVIAEGLSELYATLERTQDLARLYGSMADTSSSADERARLRLLRAGLLVDEQENDAAISVLRQTLAELPIHDPSVRLLASLLESKRAFADLCALFEAQGELLSRAEPERSGAVLRRACDLAENELKDVARAARSFKKIVDLDPKAENLDRFASLLQKAEHHEEEAVVLERLVETAGENDDVSLRLATAYGKSGQVERARDQLERAVSGGHGSSRVREVLAGIYRAALAWEPLAKLFHTEAEEADEVSAKVERLREAANIYLNNLRDANAAVPLLEQAAALAPGELSTLFLLSEALRVGERLPEARDVLGRILAEFGTRKPKERALVHFELAKLALATKDHAAALTELDSASKIDPAHGGVLQLLAEVALEEGQLLRAQRTYRGLLLVLRSQRGDKVAATPPQAVHKSQVLVELAYIAERQREAERKAEFIDSAFDAAKEDEAEYKALVAALDRRGYSDLVARALRRELEREDLPEDARTRAELSLAEVLGKKLSLTDEAVTVLLGTLGRLEGQKSAVSRAAEAKISALLKELGELAKLYDALLAAAERADAGERAQLLLRAAALAESDLKDDTRAADALELVLAAWNEAGMAEPQQRADVLARLDEIVSRLVESGAQTSRLARVLEAIIQFVTGEGGSFAATSDTVYRLLSIRTAHKEFDEAHALLERAIREDADGDRLELAIRAAVSASSPDTRFLRLLEDFGRERKRARAVVDALEVLADGESDPIPSLKEAYEASLELEDTALSERLLRRIVPKPGDDTTDFAWALSTLAEARFAASDAREAADLWERAALVSDPDEERALLLRVADLSDRTLSDHERAIRIYGELHKHEPADREVWVPLADIYRRRGDTEALAALMDETIPLIDDLRERAHMRFTLAKMLEITDPDRAADVLTEAIDEDPGNRETGELLERLFAATGRDDKLIVLLERQLDLAKDSDDKARVVSLGLRIGALRERLGELDAALDAYHGALDWDDTNVEALRNAVRLHGQREDSLVLTDLLDRLLDVEEGDGVVDLSLKVADMKLASGDPPGAERALLSGFKANPRNPELKQRLTTLYNERGDRVGLARLTAAEARFVTEPRAKRDLLLGSAETIKNEGDQHEAADLYAEALDADPADRDTLFSYLETCANTGQHARGIAAVDRALLTDKDDAWLLFSRAVLREATGDSDDALDDLERAFDKSGGQYAAELRAHLEAALARVQRDPAASRRSKSSIRLRLAEVSAASGDSESARLVVEELVASEPDNAEAFSALARIEELAGRTDQAAITYARAVGLASGPALMQIVMRLYEACARIDRLGLARSGVERAYKADPTDPTIRAALRSVYEDTGAILELCDLIVEESAALDDNARFEKLLEASRLLLYGNGESSTGPQMAERALAVLEDAKSLRAGDQDLLQLTSEALAASGRGEEARAVLAQLIAAHRGKRSRELGQAYYSLYRVESKTGNLSEAIAALVKAFDNQSQNGGLALELGQLALDLDEQDIAQRAYRAITLMKVDGGSGVTPQDRAIAYFHLGSMAFKQGDMRRARLMLDKSVAEDGSLDAARELLAQLV